MQTRAILHKIIKKTSSNIHSKRLNALLDISSALLNHGKLSLSSLGRHLKGQAKVKHKIKKVDRLLSNGRLHLERMDYYRVMARSAIGNRAQIMVIVDWSPAAEHDNQILRASLAMKHRSITLYEEVHPEKHLGKLSIHKIFLNRLKQILPSEIKVLIVTDAGFRTEWFELVASHGWDFEGRVRIKMMVSEDEGRTWIDNKSLYKQATHKATYVGKVWLTKTNKLPCEMYLYKETPHNRKKQNRRNKTGKMTEIYRKSYKDPWLLVTSESNKKRNAEQVVKRYKLRMKIEHEFRDTKDAKWGIGFRYCKTFDSRRLEILLLIAAIALFQLWLIGLYAEKNEWQYGYQANTIKTHRVLSLVFLGLQLVLHEPEKIKRINLIALLQKGDLDGDA